MLSEFEYAGLNQLLVKDECGVSADAEMAEGISVL
jgi:hypothetical protein